MDRDDMKQKVGSIVQRMQGLLNDLIEAVDDLLTAPEDTARKEEGGSEAN